MAALHVTPCEPRSTGRGVRTEALDWHELSNDEQYAAWELGFTPESWDDEDRSWGGGNANVKTDFTVLAAIFLLMACGIGWDQYSQRKAYDDIGINPAQRSELILWLQHYVRRCQHPSWDDATVESVCALRCASSLDVLRRGFVKLVQPGNVTITWHDWHSTTGYTTDEDVAVSRQLFDAACTGGYGFMDFQDYVRLTVLLTAARHGDAEAAGRLVFQLMDTDGDGSVTMEGVYAFAASAFAKTCLRTVHVDRVLPGVIFPAADVASSGDVDGVLGFETAAGGGIPDIESPAHNGWEYDNATTRGHKRASTALIAAIGSLMAFTLAVAPPLTLAGVEPDIIDRCGGRASSATFTEQALEGFAFVCAPILHNMVRRTCSSVSSVCALSARRRLHGWRRWWRRWRWWWRMFRCRDARSHG